MQISAFLSFLTDVGQTFFSTLELLLTRIIPVFAIFIAALLLRFFHWIVTLTAGSSKPRCYSSFEDRTGEGLFDKPLEDDDGRVVSSNENDDHSYLEENVPLQSDNPCSSTVSEDDTISRNSPQIDSPDSEPIYPSDLPVSLDDIERNFGADAEPIYPSDLPASLDDVERNPGADLHPVGNRTLPPSWSLIKRTLEESSGEHSFQEESQETLKNPVEQTIGKEPTSSKPEARKSESERFTARFRRHFLLDR